MKPSNITSAFSLSLLLCSGVAFAEPDPDPFAELSQEMKKIDNEGSKEEMEEFQRWKASYLAEYQEFRQKHFNRLDDIRDQLIATWGESEISTATKLVEYSKDDSIKSVYDYEANEIRISVMHPQNQEVSQDSLEKALTELEQLSQSEFKDTKQATSVEKLLANADKQLTQVAAPSSSVLEAEAQLIEQQAIAQKKQVERLSDLAEVSVPEAKLAKREVKTEQEINKQLRQIDQEKTQRLRRLQQTAQKAMKTPPPKQKITTYTIALDQRSEMTMAKPYIEPVLQQAARWQLEPSLMMAIIHTESHFNPKAKSHVPAFGLMQIVPLTAGRDVNRFLFKQNEPMDPAYLLKPSQNIEAGVAYMHLLNSRYLKRIKDPQSRRYCMIAAYNTGSGNVARSFNQDRSRNIKKAAAVINSLKPEQVYDHLSQHLPYEETKKYLKKVTKRQNIYSQLDKI